MKSWDNNRIVKQSDYDFNPFRESDHGKYFKTVTNIYEDWSKELKYANTQQRDLFWPSETKGNLKDSCDPAAFNTDKELTEDEKKYNIELEDMFEEQVAWAKEASVVGDIPKDFVLYRMWTATKKECPILTSLADKIGLKDATVDIQTQSAGMMLHLHIDSLIDYRKKKGYGSSRTVDSDWARVFVMLEDWKPGHIIQFGNTYLPPWKAGDVIWFNWSNIPHSTANTGPWPRSIAKITGKQTEKYKKLL